MYSIEDLSSLLKKNNTLGVNSGKLFTLDLVYGFEKGGVYEDWGCEYVLTLHEFKHHWMSNLNYWVEGNENTVMIFRDKNLDKVIGMAKLFILSDKKITDKEFRIKLKERNANNRY